ncbi:Holliday junction resolvase [Candidatus Mesenet endosymbiont of Agriotes lineatus]|uniref:Holliday junction resolvase n=1 Tax=Candidatus Mesenet endosymbiont of Agriotes lineatus TaxID=3077948 RepID=UPI0030CE69BF
MSILTLDLGQQTGWAILEGGVIESGSKSFHVSRFSGGGMQFLNFSNWLNSLKQKFSNISVVYFEEVRRHLGTDAAHIYGGFLAHLTAWCELCLIKVLLQKAFYHSNASKSAVIAAIKNKGFTPSDDNEADSLALLFYAMNLNNNINNLSSLEAC